MSDIPKSWPEVLEQRKQQKLESLWIEDLEQSSHIVAMAPNDLGVRLNGGRPGSRYAPKALKTVLDKMTPSQEFLVEKVSAYEFCSHHDKTSLEQQQKEQTQFLKTLLKSPKLKSFLHLGGGHDHIYPFLMALNNLGNQADLELATKGVNIINIDAHLDTRIDPFAHSGTPFRQWAADSKIPFQLIQVGIHRFANPQENYHPLPNGQMDIWPALEKDKLISWLEQIRQHGACPEGQIILSIDADGLNSQCMEAVSAVNPNGMDLEQVLEIVEWLKTKNSRKFMGIYEYNPIYDNLSQKGAKALSAIIYEFWRR